MKTVTVHLTCPECGAMFETVAPEYAELTLAVCPCCSEENEFDLRNQP